MIAVYRLCSLLAFAGFLSVWTAPSAAADFPYERCEIDSLELSGVLREDVWTTIWGGPLNSAQSSMTTPAWATGRCIRSVVSGTWVPATFHYGGSFDSGKGCAAKVADNAAAGRPVNEYVFNGTLTVSAESTNYAMPAKLRIGAGPVVSMRRNRYAIFELSPLSDGSVLMGDMFIYYHSPDSEMNAGNLNDPTYWSNNGGPLRGTTCFWPPTTNLKLTGPLSRNEPDDTLTDLTTIPPPYDGSTDDLVDPNLLADVLGSLADLVTLPEIPMVPGVPVAGGVANYTVQVRYRSSSTGFQTINVPAVVGVPLIVPVPNYTRGGIAENVTVYLGPDQERGGGFIMKVDRPVIAGTCYELPADIKAIAQPLWVSSPQKFGNTDPADCVQRPARYDLGFQAIGVGGSEGAPRTFSFRYSDTKDAGLQISLDTTPACGVARPLHVIGRYAEYAGKADYELRMKMPTAISRLRVGSEKSDDGASVVTYRATAPLDELSAIGVKNEKPYLVSIRGLPENLDVCTHQGNACNAPSREKANSSSSGSFSARDALGKLKSVTINWDETSPKGGRKSKKQLITDLSVANLTFDVVINEKESSAWNAASPLTAKKKVWLYFDTKGAPLIGRIENTDYKGSKVDKRARFTSSAPSGFQALERLVYVTAYWAVPVPYFKVRTKGMMNCASPVSLGMKDFPGEIEQMIPGWLCSHNGQNFSLQQLQ